MREEDVSFLEPDVLDTQLYMEVKEELEELTGKTFDRQTRLYHAPSEEYEGAKGSPPNEIFLAGARTEDGELLESYEEEVRKPALVGVMAYILQYQQRDGHVNFLEREGFSHWVKAKVLDDEPEEYLLKEDERFEMSSYRRAGPALYRAYEDLFGEEETLEMAFRDKDLDKNIAELVIENADRDLKLPESMDRALENAF